jgi:hypothetical protein
LNANETSYMTDFQNIISSKIVGSEWNDLWKEFDISGFSKTANTLVVSTPYATGSAEEMQLQKMMQACKLADTDYNVLQLEEGKPIAWHALRDGLKPAYILLLGITPQQIGISAMFSLYYPNRFNDCVFIPGLSLQESEKQAEAKKQLWLNGLKPVFVDKANNS